MAKHIGKQSILFEKNISIKETSSIVGKKEAEGPLSDFFDIVVEDSMFGQDSWEKAESDFDLIHSGFLPSQFVLI